MPYIPRSHIYRDTGVAAFLPGLQGWMFGPLGWSSGPAKLVGWPLQLKSGTAADFTCKLCLKNKTKRQSHLTLGYFLVQYPFALHPPFNTDLYFMLHQYKYNFATSLTMESFVPMMKLVACSVMRSLSSAGQETAQENSVRTNMKQWMMTVLKM